MWMKNIISVGIALLLTVCAFANGIDNDGGSKKRKKTKYKLPKYSKEEMLDRIEEQGAIVDVRWNRDVRYHIRSYTVTGRRGSEIILGRSAIYFPIFEAYLEEYGLPDDLKYMTVIESALKPKAKSPVGAGGLWQFMPRTARKYGLKIDNYVDERYDTALATEAAMKYLTELYDRFDDWTLAIAAYNCGEGTVEKAIRKGRSRDFWKIKKHLPKETQQYISKYIAATYMMKNYLFHDLHPDYPDYDVQLTKAVKVYDRKSLKQIAEETGHSLRLIKKLNPSYKRGIIPPSAEGSYLVLPLLT